jgi:hypothetical protein
MDHLKHCRLTGPGSASENAERVMERHLHSLSLPGIQLQSRTFLKGLWCKFEVEQYSVGLARSIEKDPC